MPKKLSPTEKLIAKANVDVLSRLANRLNDISTEVDKTFNTRIEDIVLATLGLRRGSGWREVEMMYNPPNTRARDAIEKFAEKKLSVFIVKAWERLVPKGNVPAEWTEGVADEMKHTFRRKLIEAIELKIYELAEKEAARITQGLSLDDVLKINVAAVMEDEPKPKPKGLLED